MRVWMTDHLFRVFALLCGMVIMVLGIMLALYSYRVVSCVSAMDTRSYTWDASLAVCAGVLFWSACRVRSEVHPWIKTILVVLVLHVACYLGWRTATLLSLNLTSCTALMLARKTTLLSAAEEQRVLTACVDATLSLLRITGACAVLVASIAGCAATDHIVALVRSRRTKSAQ